MRFAARVGKTARPDMTIHYAIFITIVNKLMISDLYAIAYAPVNALCVGAISCLGTTESAAESN